MHHRLLTLTVLLSAELLASCSPGVDVLARLPSPDGRLDAVHVQPKTDATVGVVDWVYVVPHGAKLNGKPIFVADKVSPALGMQWSGSALIIKAQAARVFTSSPAPKVGNNVVPVRLQVEKRED